MMKQRIVLACVLLAFLACDLHAKGKKKPKPPETVIAECEDLVLQNEFDDEDMAPWDSRNAPKASCIDGRLIIDPIGTVNSQISLELNQADFVVEALLRCAGRFYLLVIEYPSRKGVQFQCTPGGALWLKGGVCSSGTGPPALCSKDYPGGFTTPTSFVFEKVGEKVLARTGKFIIHADGVDLPTGDGEKIEWKLGCTHGALEIDHIYIWKARPKKGKKKRK